MVEEKEINDKGRQTKKLKGAQIYFLTCCGYLKVIKEKTAGEQNEMTGTEGEEESDKRAVMPRRRLSGCEEEMATGWSRKRFNGMRNEKGEGMKR